MKPSHSIRVWRTGLRFDERSDGSWSFDTNDLEGLRRAIGEDLLVGLLRCFVWVDRLQSVWHFHNFNIQNLPQPSVAFARNGHALVSETVAVLHEAAQAIRDLNRAGIKAELQNTTKWEELRAMARRWERDQRLNDFRDKVKAHVDLNAMRAGLQMLCAEEDTRIVIIEGDDHTVGRTAMSLGYLALLNGAGLDLQAYGAIIEIALNDAGAFRDLVQDVFYELLSSKGVM